MYRMRTFISVVLASLGGYLASVAFIVTVSRLLPDPPAGAMSGDLPIGTWLHTAALYLFGGGFAPFVAALFVFPTIHALYRHGTPATIDVLACMLVAGLAIFATIILALVAAGGSPRIPLIAGFCLATCTVIFAVVTGTLGARIRRSLDRGRTD
jgi:hypothetical protein